MATAAQSDYASPPDFSRSSSLSAARSPDTASAIYPERAIRPLPRNRLKSRLSPEQASTIIYPPEPPPISPTLTFPAQETNSRNRMSNGEYESGNGHHIRPHSQHRCTCDHECDSGDEEIEFDHPDYRYAPPPTNGVQQGKVLDNVQRRLMDAARVPTKPAPPGSVASSADGYESFENTSNKKKRKIPLSGTSSMHQSQLSAEMASMGISGNDGAGDELRGGRVTAAQGPNGYSASPAAGNAGTGISGAGRGRYGRASNVRHNDGMRRPLGSSSMNAVNYRMPARSVSGDGGIENTNGIISQAIKSAAEQGPLTPQKGQSLLQEASASRDSSTVGGSGRTNFTFAVESESAKVMEQQQQSHAQAYGSPTPGARQPAPPMNNNARATSNKNAPAPPPPHAPLPPDPAAPKQQQAPQPPPPPPKPRRTLSRELALQSSRRARAQRDINAHHLPRQRQQQQKSSSNAENSDLWLCQFCEYEAIFSVPPTALIRQYEIKARHERKRAEEKRRLLEKAKAKGRKGKKKGTGKKGGNAGANGIAGDIRGEGEVYDDGCPDDGYGDGGVDGGEEVGYEEEYYQQQQTQHVPGAYDPGPIGERAGSGVVGDGGGGGG